MWNKLTLWKLSWFRCLLYACAMGWAEFDHLTEGWTQADWSHQGSFSRVKLFGTIIFGTVILIIIAFLDQTITGVKNNSNDFPPIPSGSTEFLKNTQIEKQNENKTVPPVTPAGS